VDKIVTLKAITIVNSLMLKLADKLELLADKETFAMIWEMTLLQ